MKELRVCEIRAKDTAESEKSLIIYGMPIVYNQPTKICDPAGEYIEIISRGALDTADLSDTRLLYNHDLNRVPLARTPKTMQFIKTPEGLEMTAILPDTGEARSVYTAVQRGDLSGMSFAFKVPQGGDTYDSKTNVRTISKIEKIYEVSVCPFPAYPQTSVEARTAIMEAKRSPFKRIAKIKINQILKRSF